MQSADGHPRCWHPPCGRPARYACSIALRCGTAAHSSSCAHGPRLRCLQPAGCPLLCQRSHVAGLLCTSAAQRCPRDCAGRVVLGQSLLLNARMHLLTSVSSMCHVAAAACWQPCSSHHPERVACTDASARTVCPGYCAQAASSADLPSSGAAPRAGTCLG